MDNVTISKTASPEELALYGVAYNLKNEMFTQAEVCGNVRLAFMDGEPCSQCYIKIKPVEVEEKLNIEQKETINVGIKEQICQTTDQKRSLQK